MEKLEKIVNLKKILNIEDIVICDSNIFVQSGDRKHGYNIGDLLNMPYLSGDWNERFWINNNIKNNDTIYKETIINLYCENRNSDELVPNIPRIIDATNKFTEKYKDHFFFNKIFLILLKTQMFCVFIFEVET